MAALTWRDVAAPDFRPAMQGISQFNTMINDALGNAQDAIKEYDNIETDAINKEILLGLAGLHGVDPAEAQARIEALTAGKNPSRIREGTLSAVNSKFGDLQREKLTGLQITGEEADQEFERYTRTNSKSRDAARKALAPFAAQLSEAAAKNDVATIARIKNSPEYIAARNNPDLDMEDVLGLEKDFMGLRNDEQSYRQGEQNIRFGESREQREATRFGWEGIEFKQKLQDRNEEREARALAQEALQNSSSPGSFQRYIQDKGGNPVVAQRALSIGMTDYGKLLTPDTSDYSFADTPGGNGFYGGDGWMLTPGQTPGAARPGGRKHNGWDLSGMTVGTAVKAPKNGVVTKVAYQDGKAGHYVKVKYDDGTENTFMHLSGEGLPQQGQKFTAGQAIFRAGNSGNASTAGSNRAVLHVEGSAGLARPGSSRTPLTPAQIEQGAAAVDTIIANATGGDKRAVVLNSFMKGWNADTSAAQVARDMISSKGVFSGDDEGTMVGAVTKLMDRFEVDAPTAGAILIQSYKGDVRSSANPMKWITGQSRLVDEREVTNLGGQFYDEKTGKKKTTEIGATMATLTQAKQDRAKLATLVPAIQKLDAQIVEMEKVAVTGRGGPDLAQRLGMARELRRTLALDAEDLMNDLKVDYGAPKAKAKTTTRTAAKTKASPPSTYNGRPTVLLPPPTPPKPVANRRGALPSGQSMELLKRLGYR